MFTATGHREEAARRTLSFGSVGILRVFFCGLRRRNAMRVENLVDPLLPARLLGGCIYLRRLPDERRARGTLRQHPHLHNALALRAVRIAGAGDTRALERREPRGEVRRRACYVGADQRIVLRFEAQLKVEGL